MASSSSSSSSNDDWFEAAGEGNLKVVKDLVEANPEILRARHPYTQETALHIAASNGHVDIVEELVSKMEEKDLEMKDNQKWTALASATRSGITRIAKCLVQKNSRLVTILCGLGEHSILPLEWVLTYGHKDMGRYMYAVTPIEQLSPPHNKSRGARVLQMSIEAQWYDVALQLVEHCPDLVEDGNVIFSFATNRDFTAFPSGCRLKFWQQWIYDYCIDIPKNVDAKSDIRINVPTIEDSQSSKSSTFQQRFASVLLKILGIKRIQEMKLRHHYSSRLLKSICQEIKTLHRVNGRVSVYPAFYKSAEEGVVDIFVGLAKTNPQLVLYYNVEGRNVFMAAIEYRQPQIYCLMHGVSTRKVTIASVDCALNTMLHMAGLLAPSNQLNKIPGAALQMQSELQWFKEIESITLPKHLYYKNRDGLTPRELFTKEHKELMKDGETWMKDTASSCSLVGSLIATIMFAVAFTVPGGNDQNTGFPMFLHKKLFKIFIISDAISLFSATASVLMFLGMLTSRYAEDDFLKSLPTKIVIGLLTLFISIATMTIAFCAALLIVFSKDSAFIVTLFLLAGLPITLFGWMQFPLLVQIVNSTYGPSIFNRNVKRWL
ncbi:uncharacterized protein LOC133797872 [Humulus lupulus]|uniref:uncharacterized protein LOC133797872 n=1 Tax=Humulus lupulus TaxID=3486 RepID=UPI002B40BAC0|nr:uncharacterized protein LOC133797872 [Humulus lupulus]XP_062091947.1 uncharacterized protein LOC133797872 [Humulus lupulus]